MMTRETGDGGVEEQPDALPHGSVDGGMHALPVAVPACAALSPSARLVLGCLEILDAPSIDGLAQITGLSGAEVRRCLGELTAIGAAAARSDGR
jgi:hypothetical protein